MARVKTLKDHTNGFGTTFQKTKGDGKKVKATEYEHPEPAPLVRAGIVEVMEPVADTVGNE